MYHASLRAFRAPDANPARLLLSTIRLYGGG